MPKFPSGLSKKFNFIIDEYHPRSIHNISSNIRHANKKSGKLTFHETSLLLS